MRRAIILGVATLASAACGAQAAVSATASVPIHVKFVQSAGINIGNALTLPSVSVAPVVPATGVGSSVASGSFGGVGATTTRSIPSGNAQLTIRGQPGDVISTTVPASFTVVRNGGEESLIVKTNTSAEYEIGSGDVVLGGAILNGNTMSVDIGGAMTFASAQNLVPGPYEGMLVVVVQYN